MSEPDTPLAAVHRVRPSASEALSLVVNQGLPIRSQLAEADPAYPPDGLGDSFGDLATLEDSLPSLRSFINPTMIEQGFSAGEWTVLAEVRLYTDIAKDDAFDPRIRMMAAKSLHELANKAMLLHGDIAPMSSRVTVQAEDGTITVERMATVVRRMNSPGPSQPLLQESTDGNDTPPEAPTADEEGSHHAAPTQRASSGLAGGPRGRTTFRGTPFESVREPPARPPVRAPTGVAITTGPDSNPFLSGLLSVRRAVDGPLTPTTPAPVSAGGEPVPGAEAARTAGPGVVEEDGQAAGVTDTERRVVHEGDEAPVDVATGKP